MFSKSFIGDGFQKWKMKKLLKMVIFNFIFSGLFSAICLILFLKVLDIYPICAEGGLLNLYKSNLKNQLSALFRLLINYELFYLYID